MTRWIAVMVTVVGFAARVRCTRRTSAQGPGAVVVTVIPGGATFFTEGKDTPRDRASATTVSARRWRSTSTGSSASRAKSPARSGSRRT